MSSALSIKTVAFFGSPIVDDYFKIEKQVEKIVFDLIREEEYVEFLVDIDGDFDNMVTSVVRKAKRKIRNDNSFLVLVLPYVDTQNEEYWNELNKRYDIVEVCEKSATVNYKNSHNIRNETMINRADTAVFYMNDEIDEVYKAWKYAKKIGKECVLSECNK